jgi:SAM-dependent methyltransferase
MIAEGVLAQALDLLWCPTCHQELDVAGDSLECSGCRALYPVLNGVPRFALTPADSVARRTQASFGYEWSTFNDWRASGETNFQQYFGDFDFGWVRGRTVLDAGCGMGRHARQLAAYAGRIVAMDFSRAIDQAARNTAELTNVICVQGDITEPPVVDETFDLVYSLGVLHHLADTEAAARRLLAKVKPGGRFRICLYWKRQGLSGALLRGVQLIRTVTTRLPFSLLKAGCYLLSVLLWTVVVLPYRALSALGVRRHGSWPLAVYERYPFTVLYNDQFDRFSAPVEQRWSRDEARDLMIRLGLEEVRVTPSFGWIAEGRKPL